jgi:hypothetical protein
LDGSFARQPVRSFPLNKAVHSLWAESELPKSRHAKKTDMGLGRKFIG